MRLGLYAALDRAPATARDLAKTAGIDVRYAREWLEQQATAGILTIESTADADDPDTRVFALPAAHAAGLLDPTSLAFAAPMATFAIAVPEVLPRLEEVYRTGEGIDFAEYGPWFRQAQERSNRPQFSNLLASEWLPALPDVVARLEQGGSVADLGCGCGWSTISVAEAFPAAQVHGYDTDEASIADAQRNAQDAGVTDRVQFVTSDAAAAADGTYDLVCCFEALHDMAHPVAALGAMRRLAGESGAVLVMDERASDAVTADDPDPVQRFLYAASVLHCLPAGRTEPNAAATGTVMRTSTLQAYAADAGFASLEVLPIEHDVFRFYRLHP